MNFLIRILIYLTVYVGLFSTAFFLLGFLERKKAANLKSRSYFVSVIVPAYNEGPRISGVLKSLSRSKILSEIIVVDDGSNDNTELVVKKFSKVRYLKNKKNMGKAFSMDRGVKSTKAPIIFFCDADLRGLTPEIVEKITLPVINNEVDMFIGGRGNIMQKTVKKWAINSGERALRRHLWTELPKFYKHRYRIEAGLNNFAKKYGKGYGFEVFSHTQPIKESKYGFFKGTFLRWWMNLDVTTATIRFHLIDRFRKFK